MMDLKKYKIVFLFIVMSLPVYAQYYITGQSPFSVKWKQIKTENFQIIFPEGFDSLGNMTANKMEHMYDSVSSSLDHKPRKISILLQTAQSYSNGYVSWAPKRSEFYLAYPQEYSNSDWLDGLAIHEFKHVVQIDKYNQGITKLISILLGEQGVGAVLGATTPVWFLEGDAVWTESKYTDLGRGFRGDFVSQYKAYREKFSSSSYGKSSFGSYNHFVPNAYNQGYHYLNYIRKNYGDSVVSNIVNKVAKNPFRYKPLSRVMKKEIGYTTRQLHNKYFNETKNKSNTIPTKEIFKSMSSPIPLTDSTCIALREGYDKVSQIIKLNLHTNEESKLTKVGWMSHTKLAYGEKTIYWTENTPDIRWGNKGSSDIYMFDLRTNKKIRLTKGNRFYAVQSKPNNTGLIAISIDDSLRSYVVLMDNKTGEILTQHSDIGAKYRTPSFIENTNLIIAIKSKNRHNYLVEIDMNNGTEKILHDFEHKYILHPIYADHKVYIEAGLTGTTDQIFCFDIVTKKLTQVSNSIYGAKQPMFFNNKIMVSEHHANGNKIVTIDNKGDDFIEETTFDFSSSKELEWKNYTLTDYPTKKYRKLPHLFNFHSWDPIYFGPDQDDGKGLAIGVGFKSQNKLSTAITKLHYGYQPYKKERIIEGTFTYLGFFPEIEYNFDFLRSEITLPQKFLYQSLKINVPLNLSRNVHQRNITIGTEIGHGQLLSQTISSTWISGINLSMYNIGTKATRDVGYKDFQLLHFVIKQDLKTKELRALQLIGEIHFPSLFKHHNFTIEGGYVAEKSVFKESYYGNYETTIYDVEAFQSNYGLLFVNYGYEFPIISPDWDLNIIYIKRLKAQLFLQTYPYSNINELEGKKFIGFDFRSDTGFIHFDIDVGLRTRIDTQTKNTNFEILFDYSI